MILDISISAQKNADNKSGSVEIFCTLESPEGSGCKCGAKSFDGMTARCEKHRDDPGPPDIGLESTYLLHRPRRSKKVGFNT